MSLAVLLAFFIFAAYLWTDDAHLRGPALASPLVGYDAVVDEPSEGEHPMIVLLHEDGSDGIEALSLLAGVTKARIVALSGRHSVLGRRHFLDPSITCPVAWRRALRCEVATLEDCIAAALARWPTRGRVVVVGLGEGGGTLALSVGLSSPLPRAGLAFGGELPLSLVPTCPPAEARTLRKATWGRHLINDRRAEALARHRGFDLRVETFDWQDDLPGDDAATTWLLPHLTLLLETT